ncbi:hypothetical protein N5079_32835 [Planotetraspora sp. A-T 1434]|uniref:hypothetical protein n=1 Tax=Planotetraspora sp. A-T 1434 TaxID=2979219 RepID=UPI0021C091E4|nr:hypothetical protein [Planotetraspora sp. A-T 1434]MCT9935001.1 hypothetical protein [Planotetraspora sp. A-T 1434]
MLADELGVVLVPAAVVTGIVATAGSVLAPVVASLQSYSGAVDAATPAVAGVRTLSLKSLAVSTMDVAPVEGVTITVATGIVGIAAWGAISVVIATDGDGVDTAAVAVVGATEATTVGWFSIHLPLAMATGAGSEDPDSGAIARVAVNCVPTVAVATKDVSVTLKSCVTAVPGEFGAV